MPRKVVPVPSVWSHVVLWGFALLFVWSCVRPPSTDCKANLALWSGSENEELFPKVEEWAAATGNCVSITQKGSVDIAREAAKGPNSAADVIWPASQYQIVLAKRWGTPVEHAESIFYSYTVFAAPPSFVEELGWEIGYRPSYQEIFALAQSGRRGG